MFLTNHVVLYCVKSSLHDRSLIYIFQTCGSGSIAIESLLIFTKYKTTCLTIISNHRLVILRFERRYPIENTAARLKSNILAPYKNLGCLRHWVTVSLHHLPKMSEVNSQMRKNALTVGTWSKPLKVRCHVVVTQQRGTVNPCARKFRNVSLKGVDMSELQAHHCITPEQRSWLFCSVSPIPVKMPVSPPPAAGP